MGIGQGGGAGGPTGGFGGAGPGSAPTAQPNMSNNQSGANAASGKPQGMNGMAGALQHGAASAQQAGAPPNPAAQAPTPHDPGWGAVPTDQQTGPTPFQQGQQMYGMPFMQSGLGGAQGGLGALAQGMGGGQAPGPYSYQGLNPQAGYNSQQVQQGMQSYLTPIPQQMPESPFLAGQRWGANGPPQAPIDPATGKPDPNWKPTGAMPLSPMQTGQIPGSQSFLKSQHTPYSWLTPPAQ